MRPALGLGDVVVLPSSGKTFRVDEIGSDGLISGPAVSVRRSGNGVEVSEIPKGIADLYFHGFDPRLLEPIRKASQAKS